MKSNMNTKDTNIDWIFDIARYKTFFMFFESIDIFTLKLSELRMPFHNNKKVIEEAYRSIFGTVWEMFVTSSINQIFKHNRVQIYIS